MMESPDSVTTRLDNDFDQMLADMRPHVLKLPHKSERQRCAQWIKKFCEPPASGINGRKNRNMYSQLLLHMLKRGALEGPFNSRPEPGPLPTLPSYMSIYFDDLRINSGLSSPKQGVPDWVRGELGSDISSVTSLGLNPTAASSPLRTGLLSPTSRRTLAFDISSPPRPAEYKVDFKTDYKADKMDTFSNGILKKSPVEDRSRPLAGFSVQHPQVAAFPVTVPLMVDTDMKGLTPPDGLSENDSDEDTRGYEHSRIINEHPWRQIGTTADWTKYNSTFTSGVSFRDDTSMVRTHERELDMKGKMIEAKFQEEKLRIQQKHDATVQKILDRKNAEIEELKIHYRNKTKDLEETITKLDKKVAVLQKESTRALETKNEQLTELKKMAEHSSETSQNEFEKKLHDAVSDFEQEKFELQKQHTRNIQELLEETNNRLTKMEEEYAQQTQATSRVIQDLENRVQQLTSEAEALNRVRTQLEKEKGELLTSSEKLQSQHRELQAKHEELDKEHKRQAVDHEQEIRSLRNKHEATVEFMKQESTIATVKSADTVADLEQHIVQLKQALEKSEEQRQRQSREMEQTHQQDKLHLEHLHENKVRTLQKEIDQMEDSSQKALRKVEQSLRDKEEELRRTVDQYKTAAQQSEQALVEFKSQVERNSSKMYEDMKQQSGKVIADFRNQVEAHHEQIAAGLRAEMEKVEADLSRSKNLREKQAREFQKQLDTERQTHDKQLSQLKIHFEQERSQMLQDFHAQKEALHTKHEHEAESMKTTSNEQMHECEKRAKANHEKDAKKTAELEAQVQELREQVVQANQLRRQQLVELGLLREEEKQKMQHEHEAQTAQVRSEMEQQRLEQEKAHSATMEEMLEKTNARLADIEREYTARAARSTETINELQKTLQILRGDVRSQQDSAERHLDMTTKRLEEEKQKLKQQHSSTLMSLQQEIETQKTKSRQLERQLQSQEQSYEEQLTRLRAESEEKNRGLIPASVRQELEDTISSLKSQVVSLQQRAQLLQEEVDLRSSFGMHHLGNSMATTLGSTASIKSNV